MDTQLSPENNSNEPISMEAADSKSNNDDPIYPNGQVAPVDSGRLETNRESSASSPAEGRTIALSAVCVLPDSRCSKAMTHKCTNRALNTICFDGNGECRISIPRKIKQELLLPCHQNPRLEISIEEMNGNKFRYQFIEKGLKTSTLVKSINELDDNIQATICRPKSKDASGQLPPIPSWDAKSNVNCYKSGASARFSITTALVYENYIDFPYRPPTQRKKLSTLKFIEGQQPDTVCQTTTENLNEQIRRSNKSTNESNSVFQSSYLR